MINYLFHTWLCAALFLLAYRLLLAQERMYVFNRFYLLAACIASYIIPLISLEVASKPVEFIRDEVQMIPIFSAVNTNAVEPAITYTLQTIDYILVLYAIISFVLLFFFIKNVIRWFRRINRKATVQIKNVKLVIAEESIPGHSFLDTVFISREDYADDRVREQILIHEFAHVKQKHTLDILLLELMKCFLWFNPLVFVFKKAVQLNHEFIADEAAAAKADNVAAYQQLLLERTAGRATVSLAGGFTFLTVKKRLVMMTVTTSRRKALLKKLSVLPVIAVAVLFGTERVYAQQPPPKVEAVRPKVVPHTRKGISADEMAAYRNTLNNYRRISKNGDTSYKALSKDDKIKLQNLFNRMSREQQKQVPVQFFPPPPPLVKRVPTVAQIEQWKDASKYGVWINTKRIDNSVLNNYKAEDFSQVFVSKLAKNTVNYGKHYYQVDLMTNDFYEKYRANSLDRESVQVSVRRFKPAEQRKN